MVLDKSNQEAIEEAIASNKTAYTGSMVNLDRSEDFEASERLSGSKSVERSASSVSGTSFASSDSEGNPMYTYT